MISSFSRSTLYYLSLCNICGYMYDMLRSPRLALFFSAVRRKISERESAREREKKGHPRRANVSRFFLVLAVLSDRVQYLCR
jgi:hypothetical protein